MRGRLRSWGGCWGRTDESLGRGCGRWRGRRLRRVLELLDEGAGGDDFDPAVLSSRVGGPGPLDEGFVGGAALDSQRLAVYALGGEVVGGGLGSFEREVHAGAVVGGVGVVVGRRVALDDEDVAVASDDVGDVVQRPAGF